MVRFLHVDMLVAAVAIVVSSCELLFFANWQGVAIATAAKGIPTGVILMSDRRVALLPKIYIWSAASVFHFAVVCVVDMSISSDSLKHMRLRILAAYRFLDIMAVIFYFMIWQARKELQEEVEQRVLRLGEVNDLLPIGYTGSIGPGISFSCIFCFRELCEGERVVELQCHHVAHMDCEVRWLYSRRAQGRARAAQRRCPMRCTGTAG
eukprot:TRINITY_DN18904_c0_g1_i1.p1 TRINITY_DN18904_c0_g1~~TRINITY_DN18904_c0_g1_i1.p1  ORF type:complete len:208 (-),score=23.89 TRINITY_DN18904_c0_g1_i1:226-849(-)